jgi:hypothetical protein
MREVRMTTRSSSRQARFAAHKFRDFFADKIVGRGAAPLGDFPSFLVRWDDDASRGHSISENLGDFVFLLEPSLMLPPRSSGGFQFPVSLLLRLHFPSIW